MTLKLLRQRPLLTPFRQPINFRKNTRGYDVKLDVSGCWILRFSSRQKFTRYRNHLSAEERLWNSGEKGAGKGISFPLLIVPLSLLNLTLKLPPVINM